MHTHTCIHTYTHSYGYLKNSPIAKHFVDQRVVRIYGGANEVMLEVVAKGMGFHRTKAQALNNPTNKPVNKL